MMNNARAGPSTGFRPTRTTRSTAASTTNSARPSTASSTISRPSSIGRRANNATAPGAMTGVKRKTRAASNDAEKDSATTKRPALSSAFSAHVTQTSLNRQLLAAQAQVTELQNSLLEKQAMVDRLEADLRLMAAREEEEREARTRSEEELTKQSKEYEVELASLKKRLADLEADHEDLDDAYSSLSHSSQSQIAILKTELTTRDQEIALLESQRDDAEKRAREQENHIRDLEEILEQMEGEEMEEEKAEENEKVFFEGREEMDLDTENKRQSPSSVASVEPEKSSSQVAKVELDAEEEGDELDVDADGEVVDEDDEDVSNPADMPPHTNSNPSTNANVTPTPDIEITTMAPNTPTFVEGEQIEAYADPGAPPPYTYMVTSPISPSSSSRSRSASIASSHAMSVILNSTPTRPSHRSPSGTPISVGSASAADYTPSRPDPLSHVRHRLSLSTPRRGRSSLGTSASFALSASSSRAREKDKDNEIVRAELTRQTAHLASLEAANARLRGELSRARAKAEGAEVLREEKRELARRAAGVDALRQRVAELEEVGAEHARKEKEWEVKLQQRESVQAAADETGGTPSKTPVGVTQQLAALRKAHAALLDEHGQLKASLRSCEIELAGAREEAESTSNEITRLQKDAEVLRDAVVRKEKDRALLERDVTFLKSLVASYKSEEVVYRQPAEGDTERAAATDKLEQRIAQLETLLAEYKSTIESLENEVDRLQRSGSSAAGRPQEQWDQLAHKASLLEEAFNNATKEVTRQADRVEELEQRLFELGGEIGGGRHVPPGTRVLSLRQNPAQEWADTREAVLNRLKGENSALLARLKELEERNGTASSVPTSAFERENVQLVPRASWEVLKAETTELQATLAQREKRLLRLQQVYNAKSAEFRDATAAVLGLKLKFYPNGQVRVTSVYDLSATFVFQPSAKADEGMGAGEDGAKMQLIGAGEGGPQELEGLMNTWIRDEMSIPCFMASVTLECYDKWKSEQRRAA